MDKITLIVTQEQLDELINALDTHGDGEITDFQDELTLAAIKYEKSEGEADRFDLTGTDKEGNHHFQKRGNPRPFILRK